MSRELIENCITSTTEEEVEDDEISIYPNPFSDKLIIQLTGLSARSSFQLYSVDGLSSQVNGEIQDGYHILDTSDLVPGIYFMTIEKGGLEKVYKIVKGN